MLCQKMINPNQVKKIHALANRLGWDDAEYRRYLMEHSEGFSVSCKDLSEAEADAIIRRIEQEAVAAGVWETRRSRSRYEDLAHRPGMASPKQLRMIEAIWAEKSWAHDPAARQAALRRFIFRIAHVQELRFLTSRGARAVIEAIRHMRGGHPGAGRAR